MSRIVYRYTFTEQVPFDEVLATINLAVVGVQSLHGEERTRLDARFTSDVSKRVLVIDAATEIGQELNQLLVGYVRREFGDDAFKVDRLENPPAADDHQVADSIGAGT